VATAAVAVAVAAISMLCLVAGTSAVPSHASPLVPQPEAAGRLSVIVSDLHFGPGKTNGQWSPFEDFRWPRALAAFLDAISQQGHARVDLIIAGDLLELWQHPATACAGRGAEHGCTSAEILDIVSAIIDAHKADLRQLGQFAERGANHLYVIPGNHDAALMTDDAARKLMAAISNARDRVTLVTSGRWTSPSHALVVEHGHQIGVDPNRFWQWPSVSTTIEGQSYMDRSWGEQFVQQLFNDVERTEPLIDNLLPLTEGVKIYGRRRGLLGASADFALFLKFNILQTSLRQKGTLGAADDGGAQPDPQIGRRLGYLLFADALADDDPSRAALLDERNEQGAALRESLNALAADKERTSDADVLDLCATIAIRQTQSSTPRRGCVASLSASIQQARVPLDRIIAAHVSALPDARALQLFVYGHTHEVAFNWNVKVDDGRTVAVFNTGAFQRLVDEPTLRQLASAQGVSYDASLGQVPLESLPACYPAVFVTETAGKADGRLLNWFMEERAASGEFIDPCDNRCPSAHSPFCSSPR
jgi:UDP-2,3-diacylglucosamine pyrophosphatase LpxH